MIERFNQANDEMQADRGARNLIDAVANGFVEGLSNGFADRLGRGVSRGGGSADERYAEEQQFEDGVRAVLSIVRPNRRERLLGWSEYRTGGAHFRATISWDPQFPETRAATPADARLDEQLTVPHLTDVLESILVGSVKNQDELHAAEEFEIYRDVVRELHRRLDEMQSCYE